MKTARLVVRLLDTDLTEAARAEIPLEGDLAQHADTRSPYHIEVFVEQRDWIAQTEAPFWSTRQP